MIQKSKIDINRMLKEELSNNKYFKYVIITIATLGGVLALGFSMKVINYTVGNFKTLSNTLKS